MARKDLTRRQLMVAAGLGVPATVIAAASASRTDRPAAGATAESTAHPSDREVVRVERARPTTEGAGVKLHRALGHAAMPMLDPFLMLDEFSTDRPEDYVKGFPDHPHRGFETVTYMIDGAMEHRDSLGNHGRLGPGSVQWMTAGRGIIHSEMPKQERGLMWGFQLWVNLPASLKMTKPRYQDIAPASIPEVTVGEARVRVLAGEAGGARGPVEGIVIAPTMLDVTLAAGASFRHALPRDHAAFAYVFDGAIALGASERAVTRGELAALGPGEAIAASSRDGGRFLLLAGRPIGEPVARYGPFVMNTDDEIRQAIRDYQTGRLVQT